MSTFPVASVQRLRELASAVVNGNLNWQTAAEVGLHVFTILAWVFGPQEASEFEGEDGDEIVMQLFALCDYLDVPRPSAATEAGLGNGVIIKMLVGQIMQYLLTQLQNPEVWKKILEKLNEILSGNNGGGVSV